MEPRKYKYIYGPVASWRIGRSLGIDPISSAQKTCTYNCVYCQAGKTEVFPAEREVFVPTEALIQELRQLPKVEIDYITFAGNGEPTLAKNLGEMIYAVKTIRSEKIAVITNASLIDRRDVQEDLLLADLVVAKLDAASEASFKKVNQPMPDLSWESVLEGLKMFRRVYQGKLSLQVMFVKSNQKNALEIAQLAAEIRPDEVEINTPLRSCGVTPLSPLDLESITQIFCRICGETIKIRSVYEAKRQKSNPFCVKSTEKRRGKETDLFSPKE